MSSGLGLLLNFCDPITIKIPIREYTTKSDYEVIKSKSSIRYLYLKDFEKDWQQFKDMENLEYIHIHWGWHSRRNCHIIKKNLQLSNLSSWRSEGQSHEINELVCQFGVIHYSYPHLKVLKIQDGDAVDLERLFSNNPTIEEVVIENKKYLSKNVWNCLRRQQIKTMVIESCSEPKFLKINRTVTNFILICSNSNHSIDFLQIIKPKTLHIKCKKNFSLTSDQEKFVKEMKLEELSITNI